jgi:ribosomal protein S27E
MVIYYSAAAAGVHAALLRVCPACQKKQVVSPKKMESYVKCRRCGALIPPKSNK